MVVKRKIPSPYWDSSPTCPDCSPALYHQAILAAYNNDSGYDNGDYSIYNCPLMTESSAE
jgi:hypothetical protein